MATLQIPKITYKDKKDFQTQGQDDEYKICAKDMNEIKSVFNNSAESIEKGLSTIDENVKKTNDARDLAKQYMEQASQDALAINGTANGIIEKVTTEDGYAQINDSSNRRLNNMIIRGNSEQMSTTGKNLLSIYKQTQTVNGITLTYDNDNKVLVANGTANAWLNISLGTFDFKKGVTYKFVGCPKGGSVDMLYHIEPNGGLFFDIGNGVTYMPSEDKLNVAIYFVVCKGVVLNNLVIKPMITTDLNATYDTYEPYTGGQPSPSPEYPQEIKAVNELSGVMSGKNLLKPYGSYPKIGYGITLNLMNDGIHVNGKCTGSSWHAFIYSDTLQAGTYYISGIKGASNSRYQVVLYKNSAILNYITTDNFKLELKEKAKIELSLFVYSGYGTFNDLVLPYMICRNENDLYLYTPYQGQSLLNYTLQNPLYKLGDIYDYIDFDRSKIVRNFKEVVYDGSDDEAWCKSNPDNALDTRVYTIKSDMITPTVNNQKNIAVCNKYHENNYTLGQIPDNESMMVYTNNAMEFRDDAHCIDLATWKSFLTQNPITVVYQLATPTEEDIPQELLTQLKQLQTYSGETNISFEASDVYPTIDLEYIKDTKKYIESKTDLNAFVENMFALQRTGKVYTVKFPLWATSHVSTGEKLDDNANLVCEPSTKTIKGQNDYENIPLFKTYDVNAYVDEYGARHITAIKGQDNFKDTGKNDVFVLGMSYYEKVWSDDQYWYYSRTDSPRDGYTIARECVNRDGSIQAFGLYAKYVAGNIDGNLYSSKGLKPARYYGTTPLPANTTNTNTSYSGLISQCHKRGSFYSGGMTCDYKYILTTFYLKYGTLNTQSIMGGCNNYSAQYEASIKSSTNNTYFPLTKAQADYFPVGASVSIGYKYGGSNLDRYYSTVSIYADNVKIIKKVALDDSNTALYLDTNTPFNTANTSSGAVFCSTMHWRSGFSDDILGRDGCPCDTKSELTNGKFPIVIQGIECMVGGYETYGNAFMNIVDATGKREVYIQNDASQLTTDIATAKSTYKKSPYAIQPTSINSWNYITKIDFDLANGAFIQTNSGQSGSSTGSGFADGLYVDNANSGQREFLGFGGFSLGSDGGLSCLDANVGVGGGSWYTLARLSINGVWGELTTK